MASLFSYGAIGANFNILDEVFPELLLLIMDLLDGMSYYMLASTSKKWYQLLVCEWTGYVDYLRFAGSYNEGDGLVGHSQHSSALNAYIPLRREDACAIIHGHFNMIPDDIRAKLPLLVLATFQQYKELYQRLRANPEQVLFEHLFQVARVSVDAIRWIMQETHLKHHESITAMVNGIEKYNQENELHEIDMQSHIVHFIGYIVGGRHMEDLLLYMEQTYPGLLYKWISNDIRGYDFAFRSTFKEGREDSVRFLLENKLLDVMIGEIAETDPVPTNIDLVTKFKTSTLWMHCSGNLYLQRVQLECLHNYFNMYDAAWEILASSQPKETKRFFLDNWKCYRCYTPPFQTQFERDSFGTTASLPSIGAFCVYVDFCKSLIGDNKDDAYEYISKFAHAIINGLIYCGHAAHLSLLEEAIALYEEYDYGDLIRTSRGCNDDDFAEEDCPAFEFGVWNSFANWPYIFFEGRKSFHRCDLPIFNHMLKNYPEPWQRFQKNENVDAAFFAALNWTKDHCVTDPLKRREYDDIRKPYERNKILYKSLPATVAKNGSGLRVVSSLPYDIGLTETELFAIHCDHFLHCTERLHWFLTEAGTSHVYVDRLIAKQERGDDTTHVCFT